MQPYFEPERKYFYLPWRNRSGFRDPGGLIVGGRAGQCSIVDSLCAHAWPRFRGSELTFRPSARTVAARVIPENSYGHA
jgi:hypothetical protein